MPEAQSDGISSQGAAREPGGARSERSVTRSGRNWTTAALLAAAAILLLLRLSGTDLWAPDEPRYAQVAEEMRALERGPADLVLLRLNGAPYTQKPPLYYWLAALAGAPGERVTEWAARLPSAVAGIALVWVTLQLGQALFQQRAVGLWSAAILLTSFRFAHLARRAQLDVLLALFESVALLAFWRLDSEARGKESPVRHHTGTLVLLHGALGCAVLTKGPVGLLPLAVMAAYLAWERRLGRMRELLPPWCWMLSIAPAFLWLAGSVALAPGGSLQDAVVENLISRFFTGSSHARPFYYYLYQFPADFLPWSLLWPLAGIAAFEHFRGQPTAVGSEGSAELADSAAACRATTAAWRFVLTWLGVTVLFFSLSAGKRGLYLLPAFPAAAMLCGCALQRAVARRDEARGALATACVLMTAGLLTTGAVLALAFGPGLEFERLPGFPIPRSFGFALTATGMACAAALLWGRRARLPTHEGGRKRMSPGSIAATSMIAVYGIELAAFALVYPAFDPQKSPRPIALALEQSSPPGSPVAVFQHRSLIGGLRYYGSREVVELESLEAVDDFLASGGGAIAAGAQHRDSLQSVAALGVRSSVRHGKREVVVLAPTIDAQGTSPEAGIAKPPDLIEIFP